MRLQHTIAPPQAPLQAAPPPAAAVTLAATPVASQQQQPHAAGATTSAAAPTRRQWPRMAGVPQLVRTVIAAAGRIGGNGSATLGYTVTFLTAALLLDRQDNFWIYSAGLSLTALALANDLRRSQAAEMRARGAPATIESQCEAWLTAAFCALCLCYVFPQVLTLLNAARLVQMECLAEPFHPSPLTALLIAANLGGATYVLGEQLRLWRERRTLRAGN